MQLNKRNLKYLGQLTLGFQNIEHTLKDIYTVVTKSDRENVAEVSLRCVIKRLCEEKYEQNMIF